MKRTWQKIQFTFSPQLAGSPWVSEDGVRLYCARAFRGPLSDHWYVEFAGRSWCSGMSADEAVKTFLSMRNRSID